MFLRHPGPPVGPRHLPVWTDGSSSRVRDTLCPQLTVFPSLSPVPFPNLDPSGHPWATCFVTSPHMALLSRLVVVPRPVHPSQSLLKDSYLYADFHTYKDLQTSVVQDPSRPYRNPVCKVSLLPEDLDVRLRGRGTGWGVLTSDVTRDLPGRLRERSLGTSTGQKDSGRRQLVVEGETIASEG